LPWYIDVQQYHPSNVPVIDITVHQRRLSVHHVMKWSLTYIAFRGILGVQMRDDAFSLMTSSIIDLHSHPINRRH
jgi:hypothetical protein